MVKYLTINGKQVPVRISYYALKKVKETLGRDVSNMKADDYELFEHLLLYSLQKGAQIEKVECSFTLENIEEAMDEVYFDFVKLIPEFFNAADLLLPVNSTAGDDKQFIEKK